MTDPHSIPGKQQTLDLDPLTARVREHLDASLEVLDQSTLNRLAQARQAALAGAQMDGPEKAVWFDFPELELSNWLMPVGALASIGVMLLALGVLVNSSPTLTPTTTLDIELLSSSEQLDTYDNLEFYRWLAINEQAS